MLMRISCLFTFYSVALHFLQLKSVCCCCCGDDVSFVKCVILQLLSAIMTTRFCLVLCSCICWWIYDYGTSVWYCSDLRHALHRDVTLCFLISLHNVLFVVRNFMFNPQSAVYIITFVEFVKQYILCWWTFKLTVGSVINYLFCCTSHLLKFSIEGKNKRWLTVELYLALK